ncbi:MAG: hypothetical protein U9N81_14220 [Bacillota bacterium]|nr:hypothetical protein [Bacillota bacterium]
MIDLTTTRYTAKEIVDKRKTIYTEICSSSDNLDGGNLTRISTVDLELLMGLYDQVFFNDWFKNNFKGQLKFSLSRRMTKTAGKTISLRNIANIKDEDIVLEIRISVEILFKYGELEGLKTVGGIATKNSVEALQLVFEHEICHVIELLYFKETNCSQQRFKTMANHLFGHTESHHNLTTPNSVAQQKCGFKIGDTVSFAYNAKKITGVICNINKRATVMVSDKKGTYTDQQGKRYAKYYVPIVLLER